MRQAISPARPDVQERHGSSAGCDWRWGGTRHSRRRSAREAAQPPTRDLPPCRSTPGHVQVRAARRACSRRGPGVHRARRALGRARLGAVAGPSLRGPSQRRAEGQEPQRGAMRPDARTGTPPRAERRAGSRRPARWRSVTRTTTSTVPKSRRVPRGRPSTVEPVMGHIARCRHAPGGAAAGCAPPGRGRGRSRHRGGPRTGISATLQPDVDGQGDAAVAEAEPAPPGHQQDRVDRSARRRQEHRQRQDQHHVGRDVVPLAEDAHQRQRATLRGPGRGATRRSRSRAWRPGRRSWLPASRPARTARGDLRRECLLHRLDEQLSQHDEPGGRGVQRRVGRGRQCRHQDDVGALQRGLGDPREVARGWR